MTEDLRVTLALPDPPALQFPDVPHIVGGTPFRIDSSDGLAAAFQSSGISAQPSLLSLALSPGQYVTSATLSSYISISGGSGVDVFNASDSPVLTITGGVTILKSITFSQTSETFPAIDLLGGVLIVDGCHFFTSSPDVVRTSGNSFLYLLNSTVSATRTALNIGGATIMRVHTCCIVSAGGSCVVLSGNSASLFAQCEISDAPGAAVELLGTARVSLSQSKIARSQVGLSSSSASDYQVVVGCEFTEIRGACIVGSGSAVVSVGGSKFGSCTEVASLTGASAVRLLTSSCEARSSPLFVLAERSKIECIQGQLTGSVRVQDDARLTLLGGTFQGSEISVGGKATLEMQEITLSNHTGRIVSATGSASVRIYSCTCTNTGGIRLRTAGNVSIVGLQMIQCTQGLDIGGARAASIVLSQFSKSGAFGVFVDSSDVTFTDCTFTENVFTGLEAGNSKIQLHRCLLNRNTTAGLGIRKSSLVTAEGGTVNENHTCGVQVDLGSTLSALKTEFKANSRAVIATGKVTLEGAIITGSADVAVQVEGEKSLLLLKNTEVGQNRTGLIAFKKARCKIADCVFNENGLHFEGTEGARIFAANSKFSKSTDGIGIVVLSDAVLRMEDCSITDEFTYGLVTGASATISRSQITSCGVAGIVFLKGAKGKVTECQIERNKSSGVRIVGGSPDLKRCVVKDNAQFGIVKAKECIDADVHGNTVEGNGTNIVTAEFHRM
jgi:hypothetical protein